MQSDAENTKGNTNNTPFSTESSKLCIITGRVCLDIIHDHVDKRSFELIITSREEFKDGSDIFLPSDGLWFTDDSKTKDGTGAGIHGIRFVEDFLISMGKHLTVFQAELAAIVENL